MERLAHPTLQWIGGLIAGAAVVLLVATWMINFGDEDVSAYAFTPILIGLVVLFIGLALFALWALNRVSPPQA